MLLDGAIVGLIQYGEEETPAYRHASIDIFLDPAVHGQGIGRDAIWTLAHHLIHERGHHRIVIDPAVDNVAAVRCYASVGFRPVGVMRRYERDADGSGWHDGLLMDLLAEELSPAALAGSRRQSPVVPATTGPTFRPLQPGSVASTACECVSLGGVTSSDG